MTSGQGYEYEQTIDSLNGEELRTQLFDRTIYSILTPDQAKNKAIRAKIDLIKAPFTSIDAKTFVETLLEHADKGHEVLGRMLQHEREQVGSNEIALRMKLIQAVTFGSSSLLAYWITVSRQAGISLSTYEVAQLFENLYVSLSEQSGQRADTTSADPKTAQQERVFCYIDDARASVLRFTRKALPKPPKKQRREKPTE